MLGPNPALRVVGGDQDAGVVNHRSHPDDRFRRGVFCSTRARAAASSAGVSAPCSLSHSATAASPSLTSRARRAASVIQAETLFPSASAASTTLEWTSASTVTASLTAGFPLGIPEAYYRGSIVSRCQRALRAQIWCGFTSLRRDASERATRAAYRGIAAHERTAESRRSRFRRQSLRGGATTRGQLLSRYRLRCGWRSQPGRVGKKRRPSCARDGRAAPVKMLAWGGAPTPSRG